MINFMIPAKIPLNHVFEGKTKEINSDTPKRTAETSPQLLASHDIFYLLENERSFFK
jgi:hypothetical protein